jgi:serine/threonine protein kinase
MQDSGREQAIFEAASRLPEKDRAAFLDQACGREEHLRKRVMEALARASASTAPGAEGQTADSPHPTIAIQVPDAFEEKPGDRIGRYELVEKLGEGGMGSVWVAEQRQVIRRKVALKVIKLGMDTKQVVGRFEAERQALALMDHPDIAKVLDAGATEKGRPYFVMELVEGVRITEYCNRQKVPTRQRLELFIRVCKAVAHAHEKGIIHRDIKPPNVLVALRNDMPSPKLIDFGIAKAVAGQRLAERTVHTAFAEFIGTPAYMSPEQAEMSPLGIDARADIYALGVLLYELLTGFTPFDGERFQKLGADEIRRIIREEEPPRPSTKLTTLLAEQQVTVAKHQQCDPPKLLQAVRGDLDWIVMKCLEKDRSRRYRTAGDLAADIQAYLNGEPIAARPPSRLYRLSKLAQRKRAALTVAGLTFLATCLLVVPAVIFWPGLTSPGKNSQGPVSNVVLEVKNEATAAITNSTANGLTSAQTNTQDAAVLRQKEARRLELDRQLANLMVMMSANPPTWLAQLATEKTMYEYDRVPAQVWSKFRDLVDDLERDYDKEGLLHLEGRNDYLKTLRGRIAQARRQQLDRQLANLMAAMRAGAPPWLAQLATTNASVSANSQTNSEEMWTNLVVQVNRLESEYKKEGLLDADNRGDYLKTLHDQLDARLRLRNVATNVREGAASTNASTNAWSSGEDAYDRGRSDARRQSLDHQLANLMVTMKASPPDWLKKLATSKEVYPSAAMPDATRDYYIKQVDDLERKYKAEGLLDVDKRKDYLQALRQRIQNWE